MRNEQLIDFIDDEFPAVSMRLRIENVKVPDPARSDGCYPLDEWQVRIDGFDVNVQARSAWLGAAIHEALEIAGLHPDKKR